MSAPEDDLDQIMAVMTAAFDPAYGEAWNRAQVENALILGNCHYGLASEGERCAGFFLSRFAYDEEELLLLAVKPEARGQGHGADLLKAFLTGAKARGAARALLEMRAGNPAEHLYLRYGFRQIGKRPNYYRGKDGQRIDAITFACQLSGSTSSKDHDS